MTKSVFRQSFLLFGLCLALAVAMSMTGSVQAQALYGSITGNVTDATGGAIPGAEVTIVNVATNYTQTGVSNDVGSYTLRNIPVGTYTLRVSLSGFREYVAQNVVITAGQVTRENVALQVGEITESITVSGAATLLKTDTSDVSAQLESKEITDLPLNQFRNYQALLNLVPGATPAVFQNAVTDTPGRSLSTNINGTNRNSNNTRIDGAQSVNLWLPHHTAYVPPSETIEVVDISTNNFDAEKGFAGGAATTVITKSGTNDLSGVLFYNHQNSALSARNFFNFADRDGDGDIDKPVGRTHIWGGTLGGPVIKDKLFFFGGFEGTNQNAAVLSINTVASQANRQGNFAAQLPVSAGGTCTANCTIIYDPWTGNPDGSGKTPFPGNIIPTDRLAPAAVQMASRLPLPNSAARTSNYELGAGRPLDRYNYDIKMDWYRSETHRIWGKFSWMDAKVVGTSRFGPGGGGAADGGGDGEGLTDVKVYGIGHNWTLSPTFLIDGNFGFTDMDQEVLTADLSLGNFGQDVLGIPGTGAAAGQDRACIVDGVNWCGGIPGFFVSGYTGFGQTDGWSPLLRDENSGTFTTNFSWTKSNHELRFGYDVVKHYMSHWQPEIGNGPRGTFNFSANATAIPGQTTQIENSWAAFMLGVVQQTGKSLQWEIMTANEWQHAWYIRDRWQVTPRLTMTMGLRYEFYPLMTRDDRPMEVLNLPETLPCAPGSADQCLKMTLDNNIGVSKNMWAPRLGFAYRLTDNDVVRAGYGITNSPLPFARPLRGFYPLTVGADFSTQDSLVLERTLAMGIPLFTGPETSPGAVIPLPQRVQQRTMPQDKIIRGYIQSWNIMYERKLPSDFVVSVGYVGTKTTHQLLDHELNWAPPGTGTAGRRLFPTSRTSIAWWNGQGDSNYHSLQMSLNRRFTNGLFMKGAYTWGHAINQADDEGWAGLTWNDPAIMSRNRANAGYNRPHILQLATVYELPWGKNRENMVDQIIGGWQVNGVFSMNSNTQFTVGSTSNFLNSVANGQTGDQVKSDVQELGGIGPGNPYFDPTAYAAVTRRPGVDCGQGSLPGAATFSGAYDCYGNVGRNNLRGPEWYNLDFSIFRSFALMEETALEFRAEFFNFTNTPKFNNPSAAAGSSNFFWITSTNANAPERQVRFGLRLKF